MPKTKQPHSGSLQFKPQKRSKRPYARVRSWKTISDCKPLGFAGYKVSMAHGQYQETDKKERFFKETVNIPLTILECPPLIVYGIRYYKHGLAFKDIIVQKQKKELGRKLSLPKKAPQEAPSEFDDLVLLVHTQPGLTGIGKKKPEVFELPLGGKKDQKIEYAKEHIGKEVAVSEVFTQGALIDIHGVTKGKGFSGPVKRDGIGLRSHKSEKARRAAVLAAEGAAKVTFTTHQAGQLGYNLRTQWNAQIMKIDDGTLTPPSGFHKYGTVRNPCVLIKGSIHGPKKSLQIFTQPRRTAKTIPHDLTMVSVP